MESKAELLARFQVVKAKYDTAVKQMNRMKHGPARTRKAMWAGLSRLHPLANQERPGGH